MTDFNVDIVYLWVNGSDKNWLNKKNNLLKQYTNFHKNDDVSGKSRFQDNDELKYSLRSIQKFCPWVRNIFLVTDNQIPKWLNQSKNNLNVIDHKDLFSNKMLPCFNSNAIEMRLHYIKNLSNNFIAFNDDTFISRLCTKNDFFHKVGKPKLHVAKKFNPQNFVHPKFINNMNPHQYAVLNSRKLIYEKFGLIANYDLRHSVKALNKNILIEIEKEFPEIFNKTLFNQFRDKTDTWIISMHAFYSIAKEINHPVYMPPLRYDKLIYKFKKFRANRDYVYIPLNLSKNKTESKFTAINKYSPLSFCINDGPNANEENKGIALKFLEKFYPNKSIYEK